MENVLPVGYEYLSGNDIVLTFIPAQNCTATLADALLYVISPQ